MDSMIFTKEKNYVLNECTWSRISFGIYFSKLCENYTFENLSQNDAIAFLSFFALHKMINGLIFGI